MTSMTRRLISQEDILAVLESAVDTAVEQGETYGSERWREVIAAAIFALLPEQLRPPARAPRKVKASQWPGRVAMVDDPEAGFIAADYLAAMMAGRSPTSQNAKLPDYFQSVCPVVRGELRPEDAGWTRAGATLVGGHAEDRAWIGEGGQTVRVACWVEPPGCQALHR